MDLNEAEQLAGQLMSEHRLTRRGWTFAFSRARRQLGHCDYRRRHIALSVYFVSANGHDEVRDTILHEIAHALAGRRAGHGPQWHAMCAKVGARPQRTNGTAAMPAGSFRATCPGCGRVHHRHRRPLKDRTYYCRICGRESGELRFEYEQ
ncbi:MAG: SprT-like domain-containing protein [Phycisphaeraceae bacterium]|nr:SprT-like domain-containing protein [Phycisphaeraceae bacterium]